MDMRRKEAKDLLHTVRKRYRQMTDADHYNRAEAMRDLKFVNVPGEQWDANMKQERGTRPCYEFNKIRVFGKRIINDMRANRPSVKIRGTEDTDVDQAEIREGLFRNIWNVSDGDSVIDHAAEYQVNAGFAVWRVDTEYADDSMFDQDIFVRPIQNPFCAYLDPSAKDPMGRDARDWLITERIPQDEFEARWPNAEVSNFEDNDQYDDEHDWRTEEEEVRIAEYWYKVPYMKEIWQLDTGQVVDSESDEAAGIPEERIVRRREVQTHKIMSCIASGQKILEPPTEWPGSMFPFVIVYGEYVYVDGRAYWWGLPRFTKDAQRSYNVSRTAVSETIAQAPKSYFWATAAQAKGNTKQWAEAHKKNYPFMIYNNDPQSPGAPQRMGGADIPAALIQEMMLASDELKALTGIFDESLGQQSSANSGRAIYARQQQGEVATFNFQDNMAKGVQRTAEIVIDLIPHIYDTERELRILGPDDSESYKRVNEVVIGEDGVPVRVNDMAAGKYDVTVTVGPNFATQRQEAAEIYGQLANQYPEMMGFAGDLVFKSMDLPYADEISERVKAMLPPQVQQMMNQDVEVPPEVQQMMQQAEMAMAQANEHGQLVQAAMMELSEEQATTEKGKAELDKALAELKAAKAEFDAHIAETMAEITVREAGLETASADLKAQGAEVKTAAAELATNSISEMLDEAKTADKVSRIDEILAGFMGSIDGAFTELAAKSDETAARQARKITGGSVRREGGKLIADIAYDDGNTRSIVGNRIDGELTFDPEADGEPESPA